MSVQTDDDSIEPKEFIKKRTVRMDLKNKLQSDPQKKSVTIGVGADEAPFNPDKYKDDWVDSLTYKKAMRSYAIRIGASYGSELDYDEDGDDEKMFNNTVYDDQTNFGKDEISDISGLPDDNPQGPDGLGFMKQATR